MKIIDLDEFMYKPPVVDMTNTFDIIEETNGDGTVDERYNLNVGCSVVGIDDIPSEYIETYVIKSGDHLKSISYRKYGTIDFWWIIAKVNGIEDVLNPFNVGDEIKLLEKGIMGNIYSEIKRISDSDHD